MRAKNKLNKDDFALFKTADIMLVAYAVAYKFK